MHFLHLLRIKVSACSGATDRGPSPAARSSWSELEEFPVLARTGRICLTFPCWDRSSPDALRSLLDQGLPCSLVMNVPVWKLALTFTSILISVQLDLFTTLKYLGFLGIFLVFVGHRALSYLSSVSTKQKTAWVDRVFSNHPFLEGGPLQALGCLMREDSVYFSLALQNTDN